MNKTSLALSASAIAMLLAGSANAGTLWIARLSQANENPPTGAPFTGTGFLVLNDAETTATITATHNITLPLTGGHIHRGTATVNGPVIFPFPIPSSPVGPLVWAIPAADVVNLKTQGLYMNFHTAVNPGGAIRDTLNRFLMAPSATSASQLAVANALDVSAGFTGELDSFLMAEAVAAASTRSQALEDLTFRTSQSDGRQAVETMSGFGDALFDHAAAAGKGDGVGVFAAASDTFGKRDGGTGDAGSKSTRPSILVGIDNSWGAATAGFAIGLADGRDKFDGNIGETEAKTTSLEAFLAVHGDKVVATFAGGYGWNQFSTSRNLASLGRSATSSHDGQTWSAAVKVSAPMDVGKDVALAPYAIYDAQEATIDGYSEGGAGAFGLIVPGRTIRSSSLEGGAAVVMPAGGLTARLQAGWRYRINDGSDAFVTSLEGSPVAFLTSVDSRDRSAAHITGSLTGTLAPNLYVSGTYRGLIGAHANAQTVELRLTYRM